MAKLVCGMGDDVLDGPNLCGMSKTVLSNGNVNNDGGSNPVTAFSLIRASNDEDALTKAKACPVLAAGGSVEVVEVFSGC